MPECRLRRRSILQRSVHLRSLGRWLRDPAVRPTNTDRARTTLRPATGGDSSALFDNKLARSSDIVKRRVRSVRLLEWLQRAPTEVLLTHYTRDIESLSGILKNGFAWVSNKRCLIQRLVPEHDFSSFEPQQFGMISFTGLPPAAALSHRGRFGPYGIMMTADWARRHNARKVLYVPTRGVGFIIWRVRFALGYREAKRHVRYPGDGMWEMVYINRGVAGFSGAKRWASLLGIYQYMEPKEHAYQREWRIVKEEPLLGYKRTTKEIINNVSPPRGWDRFLRVLPLTSADVASFVCPKSDEQRFRSSLPQGFKVAC